MDSFDPLSLNLEQYSMNSWGVSPSPRIQSPSALMVFPLQSAENVPAVYSVTSISTISVSASLINILTCNDKWAAGSLLWMSLGNTQKSCFSRPGKVMKLYEHQLLFQNTNIKYKWFIIISAMIGWEQRWRHRQMPCVAMVIWSLAPHVVHKAEENVDALNSTKSEEWRVSCLQVQNEQCQEMAQTDDQKWIKVTSNGEWNTHMVRKSVWVCLSTCVIPWHFVHHLLPLRWVWSLVWTSCTGEPLASWWGGRWSNLCCSRTSR